MVNSSYFLEKWLLNSVVLMFQLMKIKGASSTLTKFFPQVDEFFQLMNVILKIFSIFNKSNYATSTTLL